MGEAMKLGYVVKRYPRFSETFIVNEILAHERAGVPVEIFAVRRVNEAWFQPIIGEVRAPVRYISDSAPKAESFWQALKAGHQLLPVFAAKLAEVSDEDVADVKQGIELALAVREADITHLHAHFATSASTIARLAAHFSDIGYSLTAHAKDIFHQDVNAAALANKFADARAVVTVSDYNVAWIENHYGHVRGKIQRIYNGLRLNEFSWESPRTRKRDIVAIGRLVEKKGFDVLLSSCAQLRDRREPFHCTIIGEGPMRAALEAQITQDNLGNHVTLAGALPRAGVVEALYRAAVHVAPCVVSEDGDRDGLPTVLVEAMALGTPCISTDIIGIPELVRHGETGLLTPERDPAALADAIVLLFNDADLRDHLSANARSLVERAFDVDQNAAQHRALIADPPALVEAPLLRAVR